MFLAFSCVEANADTWVNRYMKSNGTVVRGYYRSSLNSSHYDNWSTKGNKSRRAFASVSPY